MSGPILSRKTRLSITQANGLLSAYSARLPPKEAAAQLRLSPQASYLFYNRLRRRLSEVCYFTDASPDLADKGLGVDIRHQLKVRRKIPADNVSDHIAELIFWHEAWPERLVCKQIRKIIEISGPLDQPLSMIPAQQEKLRAYILYARTELIVDRWRQSLQDDVICERGETHLKNAWGVYRTAAKRLERFR